MKRIDMRDKMTRSKGRSRLSVVLVCLSGAMCAYCAADTSPSTSNAVQGGAAGDDRRLELDGGTAGQSDAADRGDGGDGGQAGAVDVATTVVAEAAGAPSDATSNQTPAGDAPTDEYNGCTNQDYVDRGVSGDRTIFVGKVGLTFSPKCMTISRGQTVRWVGNLKAHPLAAGNPSDHASGSSDNPIEDTSVGDSVEFTFLLPGVFPYYCENHAFGTGQGMAGVVFVR